MSAALRKIVHIDMDAFYASVEQRDHAAWRGQPVVVAWVGSRSVVCAASYEARKFGVHSAMPALRAQRLCPHAIFVPPDFNRYREASRHIRAIFARYTDLIEPLSLDEAYLDVTVNKLGLPSATVVAEAIRAQIKQETQLTASAGVAPNKFLAKIASDWNKPDGLCVIKPSQVREFLTALPVHKIPGVGKVTQEKLAQLGIVTVADLETHEVLALEHHFGRYGRRLYELARGIDLRAVQTDQPRQQISSETTFPTDVPLNKLRDAIVRVSTRVWEQATQKGTAGRTVVLKLKTAQFRILTRSQTNANPPTSAAELATIAQSLCERVALPVQTHYRLVGVGMSNFSPSAACVSQRDLFAEND